MDLNTFFKQLPKVELHCHLEGAARPSTFADLGAKHGLELPSYEDPAQLYQFEPTLPGFLKVYSLVSQSIRDRDDFRRITYEALEDAAGWGVRYREMFWSPMEHLDVGVPFRDQVEGIVNGLRDAEKDFGIQCRMICGINREESPERGVELVQHMIDNRSDYIIGVGLDYDEAGNPPEKMWKAFRLAGNAGFRRTAHACEYMRPPADVETCLDLLGCERIDHGYRTILDAEITKRCADDGVVFTTIPVVQTYGLYGTPKEWEEHGLEASEFPYPIKSMLNRGLRVTFNSDDPGILRFDLLQDYAMAAELMGFGPGDFKTLMLNGIDGAWLDETTKGRWRKEWSREIDAMILSIRDE